jgi:hypothetical protein
MRYFKLDENKNAIPCNAIEWSEQFETMSDKERRVGIDIIDGKLISTVFLGLNHSHDKSEIHIFETMIFNQKGKLDELYCDRYATWKEAEIGHKKAIEWVKKGCKECLE